MLLEGASHQAQYKKFYETAIEVAKKHLFFRPMNKEGADILISGNVRANSETDITLDAQGQHLSCFAGGMMGIASKIFNRPDDLPIARKLVYGCIWAYNAMPSGIMPETFHTIVCGDATNCPWDENVGTLHPSSVKSLTSGRTKIA
jgi:mannosyl-oligosaccharide alpha-1,2-mannosidase